MKVSSKLPGDSFRVFRPILPKADDILRSRLLLCDLPGSEFSRVQFLSEKFHLFLDCTIFLDPPLDGIDRI